MTLKQIIEKITGHEKHVETKRVVDRQQEELQQKIEEVKDSSEAVVKKFTEEIEQSERVIRVAREAMDSMKKVEHHH